jgi:hypothetical protein
MFPHRFHLCAVALRCVVAAATAHATPCRSESFRGASYIVSRPMSALGVKRTLSVAAQMSANGPVSEHRLSTYPMSAYRAKPTSIQRLRMSKAVFEKLRNGLWEGKLPICDKPTKVLMHEFAKEQLKPGQIFERKDAVDWFGKHYPNIRPTTVQLHVEAMAINSTDRKHHPNIKPGSGHDLFFKISRGKYRLWNKDVDPAPTYLNGPPQSAALDATVEEDVDDQVKEDTSSDAFAYERDLRNYLAKNLQVVENGLKIYEEEELDGIEYPVGGRYIDILAVDEIGDFVVIELKVSRGYDRTAGQLLRYMAWVKKNLAGALATNLRREAPY